MNKVDELSELINEATKNDLTIDDLPIAFRSLKILGKEPVFIQKLSPKGHIIWYEAPLTLTTIQLKNLMKNKGFFDHMKLTNFKGKLALGFHFNSR